MLPMCIESRSVIITGVLSTGTFRTVPQGLFKNKLNCWVLHPVAKTAFFILFYILYLVLNIDILYFYYTFV
jgi:hypothetical protein